MHFMPQIVKSLSKTLPIVACMNQFGGDTRLGQDGHEG